MERVALLGDRDNNDPSTRASRWRVSRRDTNSDKGFSLWGRQIRIVYLLREYFSRHPTRKADPGTETGKRSPSDSSSDRILLNIWSEDKLLVEDPEKCRVQNTTIHLITRWTDSSV